MILQKIVIENIRSHKYLEFEPAEIGITAISGENGAGKSTIVDAFSWCLFGTKLHALRNQNYIREGVDPKVEPVRATAYFIEGNKEYKVERSILTTNGVSECNVYSKLIGTDEYEKECGPGISHSEREIKKILNTDEKGFLSSIFVQQKQVDQIISASAKERGQVIEKMIGVSSITEALNLQNEESKALQRSAKIIQPGSLDDELKKVNSQKNIVLDLKKEIKDKKSELSKTEKRLKKSEKELNAETEIQTKLEEITIKENQLKSSNKLIAEQMNTQKEFLENNKSDFSENLPVDVIKEEYDEISKVVNSLTMSLANIENKILNAQDLVNLELNKDEISKKIETFNSELLKTNDEIETLKDELLTLSSKNKTEEEYLNMLESGQAECKLCGKDVENPLKEIEKTKIEIVKVKDNGQKLNSKLKELKKHSESLKEKISEKNEKLKLAIKSEEAKIEIKKDKIELNKIKKELEKETKEYKALNEIYYKAKAQIENKTLIEETKKQYLNNNETYKKNQTLLEKIEKFKNDLNCKSKSEYNKMKSNFNELNNLFNLNTYELQTLNSKLDLEIEKGKMYLERYRECEKANKLYKELHDQLTVVNLSKQNLKLFKEERIKTSVPALTEIASEILSKFTEGKFTQLLLTEKFDSFVVTDTGITRPVAQLSGGEMSAAAIALRIAIALFLVNGQQQLLILDEVLTAMSDDRSQLILETIASLTNAQIIIIAHNAGINSFADKVFEL